MRPDEYAYTFFPSGDAEEAFANTDFLRQEYKCVSPWYGVAAYAIAASTGYLRKYNNKHWFNALVACAWVGIIFTKLPFWLYLKTQHKLFKDKLPNTIVLPTFESGAFGVGMVHRFYITVTAIQ